MKLSALILLVTGLLLAFNSQTLRNAFSDKPAATPAAQEHKKE